MLRWLWTWVALPFIHFLAVGLTLQALSWLLERLKVAAENIERSNSMAMHLPVNAKMAECAFQVTRADGRVEPTVVHRTYRNPLRRWAWAIQSAFKKGA